MPISRKVLLRLGLAWSLMMAWILAIHQVPLPWRLSQPGSLLIEYRDGTPAFAFLSPDGRWRVPVRLEEVDPDYVRALLHFEDRRFHAHPGVDAFSVFRAARKNLSRGQVVSGASTITMQLVRVLEPRPRTYRSKLLESAQAVQLETLLSKRDILEAYLTFIPFGRNLEGVEAASLAYFGHLAANLSPAEIATLLAVPQNPNVRYPNASNAGRLKEARDRIAQELVDDGILDTRCDPLLKTADCHEELLTRIQSQPVPSALRPFPRDAPHAARWLSNKEASRDPARSDPRRDRRMRTTLDRGVQRLALQKLAEARPEATLKGIHNASVVVVDHTRGEILALAGSFDFWESEHGGQIIGFDNARSPGSALKPFIYAMAIDRGLALPEFLVADVPLHYSGYSPRNFDGSFSGLVRLEEALSRSLNIPFVQLLQKIGVEQFLSLLQQAGVTSPSEEPGRYGLSVAAGGIELTPLEMASLYTMIAEEGNWRPLQALAREADEEEPPPTQLLSKGAAFLTVRALALKDRPDFPARRDLTDMPRGIHWKTGTSFGHRDAWAIGSDPVHTVVVWMGNFNNAPSVELVGAQAAGPLLFDLLEGLANRADPPHPARFPDDLSPLKVCAWSGRLATRACPETRTVLAPEKSAPAARCPYHVHMDVEVQSGLALSPACRAGRNYETRTFLSLPASVRRFLQDQNRPLPVAPDYAPGCAPVQSGNPPLILSPPPSQVVVLLPGVDPKSQEIPLEAESGTAGTRLNWFVDGEFLGSVAPDERLWWRPIAGKHRIVVQDDAGLSAEQVLKVQQRK